MNHDGAAALPKERCRSLLLQDNVGRVAFTSRALPAVVPVRYRVDGERLVLKAVVGSEWPARAAGSVVAFEVDQFGTDQEVDWSVLVVGRAERNVQGGRDGVTLDLAAALLTGEARTAPATS